MVGERRVVNKVEDWGRGDGEKNGSSEGVDRRGRRENSCGGGGKSVRVTDELETRSWLVPRGIQREFGDESERVVCRGRLQFDLCGMRGGPVNRDPPLQPAKPNADALKIGLLDQFGFHRFGDTKVGIRRPTPIGLDPEKMHHTRRVSFKLRTFRRAAHHFAVLTTKLRSPSLSDRTEYPVLCQSMMRLLRLRNPASWTTGRVGIAGGFWGSAKGRVRIQNSKQAGIVSSSPVPRRKTELVRCRT